MTDEDLDVLERWTTPHEREITAALTAYKKAKAGDDCLEMLKAIIRVLDLLE